MPTAYVVLWQHVKPVRTGSGAEWLKAEQQERIFHSETMRDLFIDELKRHGHMPFTRTLVSNND